MSYPLAPREPTTLEVLGLPAHPAGPPEIEEFISRIIARGEKALVLNLNIHCANLALQQPWLKELLQRAQLVFVDGDGIRLGLKILGYSPPPKVTYNEWIWELARFCESRKFSLFLLGGSPGIAGEAADALKSRHPGLRIAEIHHGYFEKNGPENEAVVSTINHSRPDVLLVCFGMPLQERWLSENWERLDAHVFLTGGAALDYASGWLDKAPAWMVKAHLEWLFRFFQEPRRLFSRYFIGNPAFLLKVIKERARRKKP